MNVLTQFPLLADTKSSGKNAYVCASPKERQQALQTANERERFINEAERRQLTSISRSTWHRYEKGNKVPLPCKNENCRRWLLSDILVYMYRQSGALGF